MKKMALFVILTLCTLNVQGALLDLKGKSLSINAFEIKGISGFRGDCDEAAVKAGAYHNIIKYGADSGVLLRDVIVCKEDPNFSIVGAVPKSDKAVNLEITLVASPSAGFKLKNVVSFMSYCKLDKYPLITCSEPHTNSWMSFRVVD